MNFQLNISINSEENTARTHYTDYVLLRKETIQQADGHSECKTIRIHKDDVIKTVLEACKVAIDVAKRIDDSYAKENAELEAYWDALEAATAVTVARKVA